MKLWFLEIVFLFIFQAGANVNVSAELKNEKEIKVKDGTFFKFKPKKVPLSFAIEHGIPKLVVALMKHGAMLHPPELEIKLPNQNEEVYIPEQLFFTAIEKCKNDRCNPERLKILNLLLVLEYKMVILTQTFYTFTTFVKLVRVT